MNQQEFLHQMKERKQELFSCLSDLIHIDSQNFGSHGNEKNMAEHLQKRFAELGLESDVYSPLSVKGFEENVDYYAGRHLEDRPNLSIVIPGTQHSRRLMLAAHLDTVPIGEESNWTVKPLGGEIHDGKIFGRGACDDKYGIATVIFLIQLMQEYHIHLPYDLVFTAYCDEEKGGGNGALAASLKYPCDDIVNLDCKNLDIWTVGCGGGGMRSRIFSNSFENSCEHLLDGIQIYREELEAFRQNRRKELEEEPLFLHTVIPAAATRILEIRMGGSLSSSKAEILANFYCTKEEEEIQQELDALALRINSRLAPLDMRMDGFTMTTRFFRFTKTAEENPALELLRKSIRNVSGQKKDGIGSCLSDLPLFIRHGSLRAFSFGAGRDFATYGGAHQPDEYIECDKFLEFACIVADFLLSYGEECVTEGR